MTPTSRTTRASSSNQQDTNPLTLETYKSEHQLCVHKIRPVHVRMNIPTFVNIKVFSFRVETPHASAQSRYG